MSARKIVASERIPPWNKTAVTLTYPFKMKVMRTITTSTILEMYMRAVTDFESFRTGILTLRVWKARMMPTTCRSPR